MRNMSVAHLFPISPEQVTYIFALPMYVWVHWSAERKGCKVLGRQISHCICYNLRNPMNWGYQSKVVHVNAIDNSKEKMLSRDQHSQYQTWSAWSSHTYPGKESKVPHYWYFKDHHDHDHTCVLTSQFELTYFLTNHIKNDSWGKSYQHTDIHGICYLSVAFNMVWF